MLSTFEKQTIIKFVVENHVLASSTSALGKKVGITGNSSFLRVCNGDAGEAAINNIFDRICKAYGISDNELQTFVDGYMRGANLAHDYPIADQNTLSKLLYGGLLDDLQKGESKYNYVLASWFLNTAGFGSNNSFTGKDLKKAMHSLHELFMKVMPERKHLAYTAMQTLFYSVEGNPSEKQKFNWYDSIKRASLFLETYTNDNALRELVDCSIVPDFLSGFSAFVNADDFSQPIGRILMLERVEIDGYDVGQGHGFLSGWLFDSINRELPTDQQVRPSCLQLHLFDKDEETEDGITYVGAQVEIMPEKITTKFMTLTSSHDMQTITLEYFDETGPTLPHGRWKRVNINDSDSKWGSFLDEFYKNNYDLLYEVQCQSYGIEIVENKRVINVSMETTGIRLDVYDEVADTVTLYRWKTDKKLPFTASDTVYLITQNEEDGRHSFFKWLVSQCNSPDISEMKQTTMSWAEYENSPFSPYNY